MATADQIPENVWRAAMSTYHKMLRRNPGMAWQEAIASALNAWPGMAYRYRMSVSLEPQEIILPLKEPSE